MNNQRLKCAYQHFGVWAVRSEWLASALSAVRAGTWPGMKAFDEDDVDSSRRVAEIMQINSDGIAEIKIEGQMTKGGSSYGGASTVDTRNALRKATNDEKVRGIMLNVDSPGGTVNGTDSLAKDVVRAHSIKPTAAFTDGEIASAAYWVAAQSGRITAARTAEVGSIGVFSIVEDLSGMAEMSGIKVHVVSTGGMKGAFAPGTEITSDQLSYLQTQVDDIGDIFFRSIAEGRGMAQKRVKELADGRMYIAAKAKDEGLIDAVEDYEEALAALTKTAVAKSKRRVSASSRVALAQAFTV